MIATTKETVNALDIFHQAVAEVMIEKGMMQIIDQGDPQKAGANK